MKTIYIVEGVVTDPEAHPDAIVGDTEWQFSDGPPGERGSSADYLYLEEGMRAHPGCNFKFMPQGDPEETGYEFTVRFRVPRTEIVEHWRRNGEALSPGSTMIEMIQELLYDEAGFSGNFQMDIDKTYLVDNIYFAQSERKT